MFLAMSIRSDYVSPHRKKDLNPRIIPTNQFLSFQMHGATTNGVTTFINAALCDHKLRSAYDPFIFDLPLPVGRSKTEE